MGQFLKYALSILCLLNINNDALSKALDDNDFIGQPSIIDLPYDDNLQTGKSDADKLLHAGQKAAREGDDKLSARYYSQTIRLLGDDHIESSTLHYLLAEAHTRLNNIDTAFEHANKAIHLNERLPRAYYARGRLYLELGKYKSALEDFERYNLLEPDSYVALCHKAL